MNRKKQETDCISHVLFPWETFAAQAEREERERANGGERWTEEFLQESRENVLRYATEQVFTPEEFEGAAIMNKTERNSNLSDVYYFIISCRPIFGARFLRELPKGRRRWRR